MLQPTTWGGSGRFGFMELSCRPSLFYTCWLWCVKSRPPPLCSCSTSSRPPGYQIHVYFWGNKQQTEPEHVPATQSVSHYVQQLQVLGLHVFATCSQSEAGSRHICTRTNMLAVAPSFGSRLTTHTWLKKNRD